MGDAISISVPVIVVAIVFVIVVSEGMVAVTVVAMVPIIHIVITPRATVVADEPVYRLRCFIASVFIRCLEVKKRTLSVRIPNPSHTSFAALLILLGSNGCAQKQ